MGRVEKEDKQKTKGVKTTVRMKVKTTGRYGDTGQDDQGI